jgi:hypothetical protein
MTTEMTNITELKCSGTIKELLIKYKDNEYMTNRLHNHIVNYLPNTLENELKNHEKRVNRNTYLTNEQNIFIQVFLSKNNYFYLPNNNFFYEYDGENYFIVKEDDIIHKLLSTISKDRVLLQWKYKTKLNIIKQIKDRHLFTSIPETDTIQNVLNSLYPSFFFSKNAAKYFLTVIGDNILKKNSHIIFLVSQQTKQFFYEVDNVASLSIGINNATNNFMTKYHEKHSYENCRLIKINENYSNNVWRELLKKIGLDMICVAAHYSKRYDNSDKFIENESDEELKLYTYYIKNKNQNNIVDNFCDNYISQLVGTNHEIEWKNLHFIWKQFLSINNLPNVIYSNNLKSILKDKFVYNEKTDAFCGITSKYLPIYSDFINFWETTITSGHNSSYEQIEFDYELEIDEISSLFKCWVKQNTDNIMSNGNINEDNIVKIIKHFFPTIEIVEDKFVLNVTCSMWNKIEDINKSFEYIKNSTIDNSMLALISFDDVYNYYYKFCKNNSMKFIVSKRYFEKYLYYKLADHIVYDKFINIEWLNNSKN